jgi:hypothetical protein
MPRSSRRISVVATGLLALTWPTLLGFTPADGAEQKKGHYLHPQYASFHVKSVGLLRPGMLPQEGFAVPDHGDKLLPRGLNPEQVVQQYLAHALASTGYRILAPTALEASADAARVPEALAALQAHWKSRGDPDTTALKKLGEAAVVDAVLGATITTWASTTVDRSVSGRSFTQVDVLFCLYSTRSGELLWREALSETGEGPYNSPPVAIRTDHDPAGHGEVKASDGGPLDPPSFEEVTAKLEKKIRKAFPPLPKGTAKDVPPASKGAAPDSAAKSGP